MTTIPPAALEAAAKIIDPLAFPRAGKVHARGFEMTSKADYERMLKLRMRRARKVAERMLTAALPHMAGWRPISEANKSVVYLVRGWGEAKRHYVFDFASYEKTKTGGFWEVGTGEELWFEPIEFMELPLPTAPAEEPKP